MSYLNFSLVLALAATILAEAVAIQCRCFPFQPCWPEARDWASLNSSIGGNLVTVTPVALPCHDPNYDDAACAAVQAKTHDSAYRTSKPGALQWQNWEASLDGDDQCYVESSRNIPCRQGRVSLFSAEVETPAHIQAAVKFAVRHNIKLVIKNTGHDFLGHSSAPYSLQISTHKLKSVSVIENFVPSAPTGSNLPAGVRAVTLSAGVQQHDLYVKLGAQNTMIVMGSANTVGPVGGYIQGGGHSLMGWIAGMASDNALEFMVVTADGKLVTANAYQNSDLFFALRGGGGGTWGVVVSVTVRAQPDYPVSFTLTNFTLRSPNKAFWNGVEAFQRHLVHLNDAGGTGYYYITPISPVSSFENVATFELQMWFVNQTDAAAVRARFDTLLSDIESATGTAPGFRLIQFPTMSSMYQTFFTGADYTGLLVQLGSRLISRTFAKSPGASTKITDALSGIQVGPADYLLGNVVAGGQAAANRHVDSALNPAWRDTVVHMLFTRQWSVNTTVEDQEAIKNNITDIQVPILKSLEPGSMGAYLNEADANEDEFQFSFWGSNYRRLLAIKSVWDPRGVFISRKGVGSEYWTDNGLCHF